MHRTLGPAALKRLGLTLAQIARFTRGELVDLAGVLELQEQELLQRKGDVDRALALVRQARSKIAQGNPLPIDELITLIRETHMSDPEKISDPDARFPLRAIA